MSKAFTKENEDVSDLVVPNRFVALPEGVENFISPRGAERFRTELEKLRQLRIADLPAAEQARTRAQLDELESRVASHKVITEPLSPGKVSFGATVSVTDDEGEKRTYSLVGVDEADVEHNLISWLSPLARALTNRSVGDVVTFKVPAGEQELEINSINYDFLN